MEDKEVKQAPRNVLRKLIGDIEEFRQLCANVYVTASTFNLRQAINGVTKLRAQ